MAKKQTSSSSSSQPAAKKKAAPAASASASADSAGAKKKPAPAKTATAAGGAPSSPLIDTSLAANAAAAFVGNKLSRANSPGSGRQESASFKNLKQKLAKPHAQGLASVLDTTNQNKKPNLPFGSGGNNQNVSHNQTYGADVNRAGVPRRTPG